MTRRIDIFLFILTFILLSSCGYHVTRSADGKASINQAYFKFNQPMKSNDFSVIDTGAIYKKIKAQNYDYNDYIKFYANGTFLNVYKKELFLKNDLSVENSSVWRGRFIVSGNEIKIEQFYPQQAPNKKYERKVLKGVIKNDSLIVNWDDGNLKQIYIKEQLR